MDKDELLKTIVAPSTSQKRIAALVIAGFLAVNTWLVYITGGIPSAFAHTMYLPVFLAAVFFGVKGALPVGLIGGMLIGPLMSLEALGLNGEALIDSLYRTAYFMLIGALLAVLVQFLRNQYGLLKSFYTRDAQTGIPNYHSMALSAYQCPATDCVALTIQIINYESLVLMVGYDAYNRVLAKIYERMQSLLPESANVFLMDKRKFTVDMPLEEYEKHHPTFLSALEQSPVYEGNVPLYFEYAVGISTKASYKKPDDRLRESEVAATYAKDKGLRDVVYEEHYEKEQQLFEKLGEIPEALRNEEFFLVYHPIVDLGTNACVAFEALLRWRHNDEVVSPEAFILPAEKTRLIDDITRWVLSNVFKSYDAFKKIDPSIALSMNVSQRCLYTDQLYREIEALLKEYEMPAEALKFEVTETTMMIDKEASKHHLQSLKDLGVHAVLDDFGLDYSALAFLKDFPISTIKIDRTFTEDLLRDEKTRKLVGLMIEYAHRMKLSVIAEGIEDEKTLELLQELGCDYGQGFYFTRPMEKQAAKEWLKHNKNHAH